LQNIKKVFKLKSLPDP